MPQAIGYALVLLSKYKELADKCSSNNLLLKHGLNVISYFFPKEKKKKTSQDFRTYNGKFFLLLGYLILKIYPTFQWEASSFLEGQMVKCKHLTHTRVHTHTPVLLQNATKDGWLLCYFIKVPDLSSF